MVLKLVVGVGWRGYKGEFFYEKGVRRSQVAKEN